MVPLTTCHEVETMSAADDTARVSRTDICLELEGGFPSQPFTYDLASPETCPTTPIHTT